MGSTTFYWADSKKCFAGLNSVSLTVFSQISKKLNQCFLSDRDCWWLQQFPARCHWLPLLPSTSLPSRHLSLAPGFQPLIFMLDKFWFLEGENLNENLSVQSSLMPGNPCQPSTTASPSSLVVEDFQDENTWSLFPESVPLKVQGLFWSQSSFAPLPVLFEDWNTCG